MENGANLVAGNTMPTPSTNSKKFDYLKQKKLEKKKRRKENKVKAKIDANKPTSAEIKQMLANPAENVKDVEIEYVENDDQVLTGKVFFSNKIYK